MGDPEWGAGFPGPDRWEAAVLPGELADRKQVHRCGTGEVQGDQCVEESNPWRCDGGCPHHTDVS